MPLTPIDVQQKTFATALRGYDLDEVDDFLDAVVVALKDYDQRLSDAQERISTLEAELNDKGDAEGAIARALVAAQRSADAIVADAKEEAQRILSDADSEANELAMRIARTHTGGTGFIVTSYAYHGNTQATYEITTADIPRDLVPDYVVTVPVPDPYRGPHTGNGAGEACAGHVVEAEGRAPGG